MNATSLYVSTCRLIILADAADKSSWIDLFRLVPYLRQSLSCTVCGHLLKEPYTPTSTGCQHHVCRTCIGGRKKLKPSCGWCKDYENYTENLQLRILLQCYKKLCEYFMGTEVYNTLLDADDITSGVNGGTVASSGLIELIQEGAVFDDDYKSSGGLSKSAYSILPCVYSNSTSTQTQGASTSNSAETKPSIKTSPNTRPVTNGSPIYSVMYAGSGNKITIKRKNVDDSDSSQNENTIKKEPKSFKKPSNRIRSSTSSKRKGCRCGNATATPGKLTCCGQRCPCYVDSKPCTECKCKGCRNPHRADGFKVRPHIPRLESLQVSLNSNPETSPSCSGSMDSMDGDSVPLDSMDGDTVPLDSMDSMDGDSVPLDSMDGDTVPLEPIDETNYNFPTELGDSDVHEFTNEFQVSASLPSEILMDDSDSPDDEDTNSPLDYALDSPQEVDPEAASPDSSSQDTSDDNGGDVEVDV